MIWIDSLPEEGKELYKTAETSEDWQVFKAKYPKQFQALVELLVTNHRDRLAEVNKAAKDLEDHLVAHPWSMDGRGDNGARYRSLHLSWVHHVGMSEQERYDLDLMGIEVLWATGFDSRTSGSSSTPAIRSGKLRCSWPRTASVPCLFLREHSQHV